MQRPSQPTLPCSTESICKPVLRCRTSSFSVAYWGWAFRNLFIFYSILLCEPLLSSSLDPWNWHIHGFLWILWYKLGWSPVFSTVTLRFSFLGSAESVSTFLSIFLIRCYRTVSCFTHSHGFMPLKKILSIYYYRCLERVKVAVCVVCCLHPKTSYYKIFIVYCTGRRTNIQTNKIHKLLPNKGFTFFQLLKVIKLIDNFHKSVYYLNATFLI